ncbi:hypothetical protein [uncultured Brachyspira sp.]|mgnify:FL=1|jgi:hypothetical protein|uniref:hypothetical protein n=1 Tax=uncultured Brachyspira sp. TaxID=221953 RepID=UPI002585D5F1|nr:hypothetical protein [uncultured Brachyspira sp.]
MITINKQKAILIILIVLSIIIGIFLRLYIFNKTIVIEPKDMDGKYQFYQLNQYINQKKFPTEGVFLNSPETYDSEINARIPGGYFYISYIAKYFIGGKTFEGARFVNLITTVLLGAVFLFWIYKRFGFITFAIMTALMSVNVYFLGAGNSTWNPNITLAFSFLFLPILYEYIYNENKNKKIICGILLFPILALIAQCHFSNFFSMIPALIIFLIIRWKKDTNKNLLPLIAGVFISFLTYLPYLIHQFQNNFEGILKILKRKSEVDAMTIIQPPQIYSILLFITNERGNKYVGGLKDILNHYLGNNSSIIHIYIFAFYVLSIALAIFILIYSYKHFFTKKMITENERETNALKDLMLFYLVYIIASIVFYMLANIGAGRPHYFYSSFTLGFVPVIYFIENIKSAKPKYLNYIFIYAFLNIIAIFIDRII